MRIEMLCNEKKIDNAGWEDIESVLGEIRQEAFFRLTILPAPLIGAKSLEIESEDGNYMPSMRVNGEEDTRRVFVNEEARGKEEVAIGGYDCLAMAVTQDFDLIVRMIKEFYETHDVSRDLLK